MGFAKHAGARALFQQVQGLPGRRRRLASGAVLGDKELDRKLRRLATKSSKKAIVAGINASMTPLARSMRKAITAVKASDELKREARRAIGKRFGKNKAGARRGIREAKVGFSVGKKRSAAKPKGGGQSRGVGISAANIHWFVLGTHKRYLTKGRGGHWPLPAGHYTGRIASIFGDVTRLAFAGTSAAMTEAARKKIKQVIEREARKKG